MRSQIVLVLLLSLLIGGFLGYVDLRHQLDAMQAAIVQEAGTIEAR